ncbi:MAG TPA: L,D-transpeptidase [Synergistaceae bacterium]|nr:L,D-transpeptidase [Synergistaceae bacterium]HQK24129.1 L,D-transpeptidase [Synergistaceae bacterium]
MKVFSYPEGPRRRGGWRKGLGGAAILIMGALVAWYLLSPRGPGERPPTPLPPVELPTPTPSPPPLPTPFSQAERNPLKEGSLERAWIRIVKSAFILELYEGRDLVRTYPIATGSALGDKRSQGDRRTPVGRFSISQIQPSSSWTHDFGDGKGAIKGAYGPWFLRLKTGWKGIGIHGTHDPDSIGKSVSEGCIRMFNADVAELRRRVRPGTPVIIEP